jgi:hypothetical protein
MRKAARIAGLVWLGLMAVAGAVLWAFETSVWVGPGPVSGNRGFIYIIFGAALPGVLLYRWGRGPYQPPVPTRELVAKAYPPKTAREMGHAMQMKDGPAA